MNVFPQEVVKNQPQEGGFSRATSLDGPDIPVVQQTALCKGCKIPRQGFLCHFSDGSCLRSRMPNKKSDN